MKGLERVIERVRTGVDGGAMDRWCARAERWAVRASWVVIVAACLYFGPICIGILITR